jgi:hypothetical protein
VRRYVCAGCGRVWYSAGKADEPCEACGGGFERGGGGRRGAGRGVRRGVSFRDALPPGRWAAAGLFLRSLAARHGCGRVRVGNFLREYRKGRKDGSDEGDH